MVPFVKQSKDIQKVTFRLNRSWKPILRKAQQPPVHPPTVDCKTLSPGPNKMSVALLTRCHRFWGSTISLSRRLSPANCITRPWVSHAHWASLWGSSRMRWVRVTTLLIINQRDALISQIYFWNSTLHVSERFSVHHQESSTVYTATCMKYTCCCVYSTRFLMTDRKSVRNM